jgi:hypothetical protein
LIFKHNESRLNLFFGFDKSNTLSSQSITDMREHVTLSVNINPFKVKTVPACSMTLFLNESKEEVIMSFTDCEILSPNVAIHVSLDDQRVEVDLHCNFVQLQ